jgi:flotillin
MIAEALSKARLVTISGDSGEGGAAQSATSNITSVIQTVLAAQLVSGSGMLQPPDNGRDKDSARENGKESTTSAKAPTSPISPPPAKTGLR